MKFSKLKIKNFRSIGPEGVEIDFVQGRNLAILIGPNGAGKSNALDALAVVLGVYPYSKFDADERDFYGKNTEIELRIELWLDPPLISRDVYQKEFTIHGFLYRAWRKMRGDEKGLLDHEHYCFDGKGKTLVKPTRIFKKATAEEEDIDNSQRPVTVDDHAWKLATAFYLNPAGLERFFDKTTGWGPLARLFEIYREDFSGTHNTYKVTDQEEILSRDAFKKFSKRLADILRTEKLKTIETRLSERVKDYLGGILTEPFHIEFSMPTHRELFEKWVTLQLTENATLPPLPIDRLGSGYRALLRLAVIETLLEMKENDRQFLLLIEEPESYLHIHLKRYFASVLRRLAQQGHQIVFTTHSPEFVDLAAPHDLVRVRKNAKSCSEIHQVSSSTEFDFDKAKQKIRRMGNEELLFASHVILVEGKDDQGIIEWLLEAKGIDQDALSISVIQCDSADNMPDYIRLSASLHIDCFAIHDADDPTNAGQVKRNGRIEQAVKDANSTLQSLHRYKPDLESVLGEKKHCGLDVLLARLNGFDYAQTMAKYPDLTTAIEDFISTRQLLPAIATRPTKD